MEVTLSLNGSVNAVLDEKVAEAFHIHKDISAESSLTDTRQVDPVEFDEIFKEKHRFPSELTKMSTDSNKELVSTTGNDINITLLDDSLSTEASTTHVDVSGTKKT